jgi:hypothetical protein
MGADASGKALSPGGSKSGMGGSCAEPSLAGSLSQGRGSASLAVPGTAGALAAEPQLLSAAA